MNAQRLLDKSAQLLRTDIRYVGKNGSWVVLGQSIVAIVGILLAVAFANWLPVHEYGVYKFILAMVGILGIFKLTGFNQAVTQAVARGYDSTIFLAMRSSLFWSVGMVSAAAAVGTYYYINDNITLAAGIFLAAVANALIGAFGLYGSYLVGKEKFKTSTTFGMLTTLGNAIVTALALYFTDDVLTVVLANTLSSLIFIILFSLYTLRSVDRSTQASKTSISFGKHLSAQNFLLAGAQHIDKILVFQFIGSVQLAQYAFAIMLPDQIYGMLKNILGIVVPRFSKKNAAEMRQSINVKIWRLSLLTSLITLIYILLAPYLFAWLFPKYTMAVIYSQIFALSIAFIPASYFVAIYFHVLERTKVLYYAKLINSVVKISLLVVGAMFFGVMGVVVAQLLARVANVLIYGYYYVTERPTAEHQ